MLLRNRDCQRLLLKPERGALLNFESSVSHMRVINRTDILILIWSKAKYLYSKCNLQHYHILFFATLS